MNTITNDPRTLLMLQFLNNQTNQPPPRRGEGMWRGLNALAQGLMYKNIGDSAQKDKQNAAQERSSAMAAAMGRPAETQSYGDGTTINWNEQKPNYFAASQMLGPDNEDLQTKMFEASAHERLAKETLRNEILKAKQLKEWEYENDPDKTMSKMMMDYMRGGMPSSQAATASTVIPQTGGRDAAFLPPQIPPINASELSPTADNNPTPGIPIPAPPPPAQVGTTPVPIQQSFNPTGAMVAKKMGLEGMQLTPDGKLIPIPGVEKPPAGYRNSADGNLEPIPGGPATKLPGNEGAQLSLLTTSINNLPEVRKIFVGEKDPVTGKTVGGDLGTGTDWALGRGEIGHAKRMVTAAVEAALRAMSGAAVPREEVERYSSLYMPTPIDTPATRAAKLDELEKFMRGTATNLNQGRVITDIAPPSSPDGFQTTPSGLKYKVVQ